VSNILAVTYEDQIPVTASDSTNDPAGPFAGFCCDVGGVIKFTNIRNRTVTKTVLAGVIYPWPILRVWSATTAASGIHGMIAPPWKGPGASGT
jgi:hypothetical protein